MKFSPDTPPWWTPCPGTPDGADQLRGIPGRLEAIDALETHFDNDHQELASGAAARDALLARLEFTVVTSFPDAPNTVEVADQESVRGMCRPTASTPEARLSVHLPR